MNGWVDNREDGDLRRHRAIYDVIVMLVATLEITQGRNSVPQSSTLFLAIIDKKYTIASKLDFFNTSRLVLVVPYIQNQF